MKGMHWFRLYAEIINDPKTGTLSDAEFRSFIELMCLACEAGKGGSTGLTAAEIDWKLRRNVSATFQKLSELGLITIDQAGKVSVKNWEKRQFKSDVSSDRVKKYREKTKALSSGNDTETFQKQDANGLDTDTDTDTEKKKKKHKPAVAAATGFDEFWQEYPKKQSKQEAIKAWNKLAPTEDLKNQIVQHVKDRAKADNNWLKDGGQFVPNAATFLNNSRWTDEYQGKPAQVVSITASRPRQMLPRVS